ncbi:bifunctional methylenetetrahydrofolate dehydrogenase/methenyltetrahydrofolate cyclohydrolase [Candidatus Epulonipiscioides gigas]|nr:bifunctional methylenetetrahydrofolate dehydrogenase/methenyltetrahydrofolate cyclohydrolase [Epulopiscium sp. SCG-C07WGA-EpuloA2]
MNTKIIDGTKIANVIKDNLAQEIKNLAPKNVSLAVILIGDNSASKIYIKNKQKACDYVGIKSHIYVLPYNTNNQDILDLIEVLNNDSNINGILVQLPLPQHINQELVIQAIDIKKDVDGFSKESLGSLIIGNPFFTSCTPTGIIELLKHENIEICGKKCVIVGRSNIVGKPLALLLLNENATVVICHSKTKNLKSELMSADIIICAVGKANFITGDMIAPKSIVIDVGINKDENGKLCGDVNFNSCIGIASYITPVPGGVGPMTIAMLLKNCIKAANIERKF